MIIVFVYFALAMSLKLSVLVEFSVITTKRSFKVPLIFIPDSVLLQSKKYGKTDQTVICFALMILFTDFFFTLNIEVDGLPIPQIY